jgi:hypothetical protein
MRVRGRRTGAAPAWLWPALGLGAAAILAWSLTGRYLHIRDARIADARAWTVAGPACPTVTEAELERDLGKGFQSFTYGDATFFRRDGDVECAPIYYDGGRGDGFYPACEFTRPGDLRVRTARGEWRFRPGPGRPATVSAPHGQARCVLAIRAAAARAGR